jgi:hypothetical protein
MSFSVIIHISNAEPVLSEHDQLPNPGDQLVVLKNPRRIDGKELSFVTDRVATAIWPLSKLNFIEVLPGEEEEDIFGFVRE